MELKETIELMESDDYKDRFRAEYYQLKIRAEKLDNMIYEFDNGTLLFEPKCPMGVLREQLHTMNRYIMLLEERANDEGIELW